MSQENQNLDENNVFNDFMKEDEDNEVNNTADANAVLAAAAVSQGGEQKSAEDEKEYVISSAVEAAAAAIASANEETKAIKGNSEEENYKKLDYEKNEELINVLGDKTSIEASAEAIIEMNGGAAKKRKAETAAQKKDDSNKKRRKRKVLSCLRCRKDKQACTRTFPCSRCIKKEFVCKFVDNITGEEFFPQGQEGEEAVLEGEGKSNETEAAIIAVAQPSEEDNLLNIEDGLDAAKQQKAAEDEEAENMEKVAAAAKGSGDDHENIMSVIDTELKDA